MKPKEKQELIRVLNMHFSEGLTKKEIAKKSNVSNTIITRKFKKAIEHGLVDYYFKDETAFTVHLENQLEERYQIEEAIVIPTFKRSLEVIEYEISKAASSYLLSQIDFVKQIGVTWGKAVWRFVREVPYQENKNLCIVPLCGGIGSSHTEIHANSLAFELADRFSCDYLPLYAPAIVSGEQLKNQLTQMEMISSVLKMGKEVDIAFVGIGDMHPNTSTLLELGYISTNEVKQLKQQGAVGDIGCMFFDKNGTEVFSDFNKKVIGVELDKLKAIPRVVGIANGAHKYEATLGALRGNLVNTLIIDSQLASLLLKN